MTWSFTKRGRIELAESVCECLARRFTDIDNEIIVYTMVVRLAPASSDEVDTWKTLPRQLASH
ncbi:hypothetical protein [Pseudomonas sp. T8]|uniref:hypothetical protein n=1 Tax=Pseudomonas sp. T8 TaxID=645292 RepID=UPI0021497C85|nr:hypothetical protein [Pseudomonas sp. T8]UUT24059.1 hypothetical protein NRG23_08860 [Pseudomonas sp. T8]